MRCYNSKYKKAFVKECVQNEKTSELYDWLFDKSYDCEQKRGHDLFDFDLVQYHELFASFNHTSVDTYLSMIRTYNNWALKNRLTKRESNILHPGSLTEGYKESLGKEKIAIDYPFILALIGEGDSKTGIQPLKNVQDKLLVYLLFLGVRGEKCQELINLKMSDIDTGNKAMTLNTGKGSRKVKIDQKAIKLIKESRKESVYNRYSVDLEQKNNKEGYALENTAYLFRKSSVGKKNNKKTVSESTLTHRIIAIQKHLNLKITMNDIKRVGQVHIYSLLKKRDGYVNKKNARPLFEKYDFLDKGDIRKYQLLNKLKKEVG